MIPLDPVDLSNPFPFDALNYYSHILIGLIGLLAALVALSAKKGHSAHIWSGRVFIGCICVVAVTSLVLLSVRMAPPLLVAALTAFYAVATAFLALKPGTQAVRRWEYGLFVLETLTVAIFLIMSIPQVLAGNIPAVGPIVILAIPVILLIGDVNFFRKSDQRYWLRIRRHLSRMIWAFVIAVRAPLAEIYQYLDIPVFVILFGPLVVAPIMISYFRKRQKGAVQNVSGIISANTPEEIDEMLSQAYREILAKGPPNYPEPMLPPWEVMPGFPMGSMAWKMGSGEDYMMHFMRWFRESSDEVRTLFIETNKEPEGWDGFYEMVKKYPKAN